MILSWSDAMRWIGEREFFVYVFAGFLKPAKTWVFLSLVFRANCTDRIILGALV